MILYFDDAQRPDEHPLFNAGHWGPLINWMGVPALVDHAITFPSSTSTFWKTPIADSSFWVEFGGEVGDSVGDFSLFASWDDDPNAGNGYKLALWKDSGGAALYLDSVAGWSGISMASSFSGLFPGEGDRLGLDLSGGRVKVLYLASGTTNVQTLIDVAQVGYGATGHFGMSNASNLTVAVTKVAHGPIDAQDEPANAFGDELYGSLAPMAYGDEDHDYALKTYCYALAQMFGQLEQFARTDENGNPPFSLMFDLDRAEGDLIRYLAQFAGQALPVGIDDESARELIRKPSNAERGTLAAVAKAVQSRLTGTKYLRIIERDTSPYHFSLFTRTAEQPISDQSFTNLITNPSFETGTTGWSGSVSARVTVAGGGVNQGSSGAVPAGSLYGLWSGSGSAGSGIDFTGIPVVAGQRYIASVYLWLGGSASTRAVQLKIGDGTVGNITKSITIDTTPTRYTLTFTPSASGTTGFAVVQNDAISGPIRMDAVSFIASYVDPGYFDGSTAGASWTGTAHASTSVLAATSPNGMVKAIQAVKPAGLTFTYNVTTGTAVDELVGTIDGLSGSIDNL